MVDSQRLSNNLSLVPQYVINQCSPTLTPENCGFEKVRKDIFVRFGATKVTVQTAIKYLIGLTKTFSLM